VSNLDALPELEHAIALFEELGDEGGLAEGWILRGSIEFWNGSAERAVEAADRAIEHARRALDLRRETAALVTHAFWLVWGPTPADEVAATLEDLMDGPAATNPLSRAALLRRWAVVEAWRGNFDLARELMGTATSLVNEYGAGMDHATDSLTAAYVALLEGEPAVAERGFGDAVAFFREIGDLGHLASYATAHAEALHTLGRDDEALLLTEEAERASIENDTDAQVHWRRMRAKILAQRGEVNDAVRLATEAANMARLSDDLDKRGRAVLDLAEVLWLAGRTQECNEAAREALDTFERKGNVVMAKAARDLLRGFLGSASGQT
jgi:tetratricopeptide (TPR) repeat protein